MMEGCYMQLTAGRNTVVTIPEGLDPMMDKLERALHLSIGRRYAAIPLKAAPADPDMIMVAYSSGLDSTAHALYWKAQGKKVTLFHVKHLNHSYPDEFNSAVTFARDFDFPMIVIEPKLPRQTNYADNPVKNQTILAYMVDYGLANGCTNYAMGNYSTDKLMEQIQGYWTSDSVELYEDFNRCIGQQVPSYAYHYMPFDKYGAFEFVTRQFPAAWPYINSCIRPYRFKDYTHGQTVKKFMVQLIPHHCGVCYKCALEYLVLADLGYYPLSVPYAKKCINTIRQQNGTTFNMGIRKGMSDEQALRAMLHRPINRARWNPVLAERRQGHG
jgi:hypothetical protein